MRHAVNLMPSVLPVDSAAHLVVVSGLIVEGTMCIQVSNAPLYARRRVILPGAADVANRRL